MDQCDYATVCNGLLSETRAFDEHGVRATPKAWQAPRLQGAGDSEGIGCQPNMMLRVREGGPNGHEKAAGIVKSDGELKVSAQSARGLQNGGAQGILVSGRGLP